MHWLAVHAPQLALDYALRGQASEQACALCDRLTVRQANAAARALGITPGIRRATALSLCADLRLLEHTEQAETAALHALATALLAFTPTVSLEAPDTVLLEIAGSLRLFGGLSALSQRIRQALAPLGLNIQLASAPSAKAACLLAAHHDGTHITQREALATGLAHLPLHRLPSAAAHGAAFEAMGIRDLGGLLTLPRAGLGRRFGPGLLADLDAALGLHAEPRLTFRAPAHFDQHLELLTHTDQADLLWSAIQPLLHALSAWLRAHHWGTRQFTLQGQHDQSRHGPATSTLEVALGVASAEVSRWTEVLREHLPRWALPAPVHTLRLRCTHTEPLLPRHGELFARSPSTTDSLTRLIDRLQARLGAEHIQTLGLADDHRPERAYQVRPLHSAPKQPDALRPELPRPLWLLTPALALTEGQHRPWWHGPLTLLSGPERIETGWWEGEWVQRDYFIAENTAGTWLWIYRNRRAEANGWFLQGFFG